MSQAHHHSPVAEHYCDPGANRPPNWFTTTDLLATVNPNQYFGDVNPAWTQALGWSEAELKSRAFSAFVHPDDLRSSADAFEQVRGGQPVLWFENRCRCKDGGYRWLSWVAVADGGKFACTARDISSQKTAEEERDRLWALSEDMLARADYAGTLSAVNPAWTNALGYSQRELLTRPYADIIHLDDLGKTVAALTAMCQSGQPTRFENRMLASNGHWKPIGWTVSPEPDHAHFIAIGRDLSDYKAREQELLQAQEALRQSQKMEAVGQLTGGIAHDFNNLLGGITVSLEMVARRAANGQHDLLGKYLDLAQSGVRRAAMLTQRLLAFSRRQTLDPKPVDANRLVAAMEERVRRAVGPAVQLEVVRSDDLWQTHVDASQLESAILNLCVNARDAMPDGGRLTIETSNDRLDDRAARECDLLPGQYVSVCVSDTGTGMAPSVAARAFDPFFTTKPMGHGTGLGLSMVYGFVRQSGGQVRVYSEFGQGTTMRLYFPRYVGDGETAAALGDEEAVISGHGEVVMLIDDDETIREVIAEVLVLSGYRVVQAADGPSGLKILQSPRHIDLLVTDVGLPNGMNGRQVADAARVVRPGLKVLFITGYAENAAVGNGFLETGMHVLTKPFDTAALTAKVDALLD